MGAVVAHLPPPLVKSSLLARARRLLRGLVEDPQTGKAALGSVGCVMVAVKQIAARLLLSLWQRKSRKDHGEGAPGTRKPRTLVPMLQRNVYIAMVVV